MLSLFSEYKWIAVAIVFLGICVGVWNVSADLKEGQYNQQKVELLNKALERDAENKAMEARITKSLLDGLAVERENIKAANQKAINEILKDPVYKSCRITDGVRNAYKSAVKAQSAK